MKIGILTYHRSENYGAVLQAYALKTYLQKQGYDAEFIDYRHPAHKEMYSLFKKEQFKQKSIVGKVKHIISFLLRYKRLYTRKKNFSKFIQKNIIVKPESEFVSNQEYDVVLYGSDQIWRKQNTIGINDFNEIYFGSDAIKAKRKIAFAASMGEIDVTDSDKKRLQELLQNFHAVSVRERDLLELIQPLTDKKVEQVLDPVFLLSKEEWLQITPPRLCKEKYILLYNLLSSDELHNFSCQLQKDTGYKMIEIQGRIKDNINIKDSNIYGPSEFLSLIAYSEYVLSSSFHALAFALLFEKEVYVHAPKNSKRMTSLLEIVQLKHRFLTEKQKTLSKKDSKINYSIINSIIDTNSKRTQKFLLTYA